MLKVKKMESNRLQRAFKKAEKDVIAKNPIIINREMLMKVHGGATSAGHVCTISGECNKSGEDCGKVIRDAVDDFLKILW